ncbi:hypothetical protein BJ166DRAFT_535187 [Pestalotiopsis sp. NC0098]|nr:hypothetical protein BJ166DRAFT_535187 [Pestalotiopsis sp. NC0098]
MAEAFGVAASAGGIVSLGLQVYSGLNSYVEGVKDRKAELSAVSRQLNTFHATVSALQDALPRFNVLLSKSASPLPRALNTVEQELWALKLFLNKLQQAPDQSPSVSTTLREQKKKLTFPFHQPTLEKLQKKLETANLALQTSLQVVDLMATTSMSSIVSKVHTAVSNSQSVLIDTQSSVRLLETSIGLMTQTIAPTQASMMSIEGKVDSVPTNESLEKHVMSLGANIGDASKGIHKALSDVPISTATILAEVLDQKIAELASRLPKESDAPANVNQQQLVMGRLMSKPSNLKDACDVDNLMKNIETRRSRLRCDCHSKTVTQRSTKKSGDFYSTKKVTTIQQHLPGCDFEALDRKTITHVRRITYTGLHWLLARSVELSISWTTGAGGSSISPSIALQPVIDEKKSPVFRLINLVSANLEYAMRAFDPRYRNCYAIELLDHSVEAIVRIYRGKKCSVYDVNQYGESALAKWLALLIEVNKLLPKLGKNNNFRRFQITAASSVQDLTSIGSTGRISDYSGTSPVNKSMDFPAWNFRLVELAESFEVLCRYDDELLTQTNAGIHHTASDVILDLESLKTIFEKSRSMSDVFEVGPLSQSIVLGDYDRMPSLIERDFNSLKETNYASQTPFHLAAELYDPVPLTVLLEAACNRSAQINNPDMRRRYPLDVAAETSASVCQNGLKWELCSDCRCCIPFDIMQSKGCQLSPGQVFFPCKMLLNASHAVRMRLIEIIQRSKEELRTTALLTLSAYERKNFQLDTRQILDAHALDVVKRLIESGVNLPRGYKELVQNSRTIFGSTVYHNLFRSFSWPDRTGCLLEMLYRSGFTDYDHVNAAGETPVELLICHRTFATCPAPFLWFLQRGADISRSRLKLEHRILDFRSTDKIDEADIPTIAEVIRKIAPLQLQDECSCGCVEAGCTTTTVFFRALWDAFFTRKRSSLFDDYDWNVDTKIPFLQSVSINGDYLSSTDESTASYEMEGTDMGSPASPVDKGIPQLNRGNRCYGTLFKQCAQRLSEFIRALQVDFAEWSHVRSSALRLFTFEALGIKHTCRCGSPPQMPSLSESWYYTEEHINEMQDDDSDPLNLLEASPSEPRSEEDIKENQDDDSDLLDLLDALVKELIEELESSGDTFERFLTRYWVGRVEEALERLEAAKSSPEQAQAAEEAGITRAETISEVDEFETRPGEKSPVEEEFGIGINSGETNWSDEEFEFNWDETSQAAERFRFIWDNISVPEPEEQRFTYSGLTSTRLLDMMIQKIDEIVGDSM